MLAWSLTYLAQSPRYWAARTAHPETVAIVVINIVLVEVE
jgi:hypothetical protein